MSVRIDGALVVSGYAIPGFPVGQAFYYGFGGSNGYAMEYNVVQIRNVKIAFPTALCL